MPGLAPKRLSRLLLALGDTHEDLPFCHTDLPRAHMRVLLAIVAGAKDRLLDAWRTARAEELDDRDLAFSLFALSRLGVYEQALFPASRPSIHPRISVRPSICPSVRPISYCMIYHIIFYYTDYISPPVRPSTRPSVRPSFRPAQALFQRASELLTAKLSGPGDGLPEEGLRQWLLAC